MSQFISTNPFHLASGQTLPELQIEYNAYGTKGLPVVWVCHALTANAAVEEWWAGLVGEGKLLDPKKYNIVCANMLGSCYGSIGPADLNPQTGEPYGVHWPLITINDMVRAHQLLAEFLAIGPIHLLIGGSMGGQQALEWAVLEPHRFAHLCVLATNAQHSPWGIAWNEAQRMALQADATLWNTKAPNFGQAGLAAARAVAMISYRSQEGFAVTQPNLDDRIEKFNAASYQQYQGLKLTKRFHPWAYWSLTRSMDSHNVGRHRGDVPLALATIRAKTLVIGIDSDVLFPIAEQKLIAQYIPDAALVIIHSLFGHDGFLIEFEAIAKALSWHLSAVETLH